MKFPRINKNININIYIYIERDIYVYVSIYVYIYIYKPKKEVNKKPILNKMDTSFANKSYISKS